MRGGLGGSATAQDAEKQHDPGNSNAGPAEPVTVSVVEGRHAPFAGGEQGDLGGEVAGAIDGAVVVVEDLAQAALGVNPTGEAVVGATDEGQPVLHGAEDGGCGMLPLCGAVPKPAVVGEVDQEISVVVSGFAGGARSEEHT